MTPLERRLLEEIETAQRAADLAEHARATRAERIARSRARLARWAERQATR